MAALFEKKVKAMQKWVLGGIVVIMVLSLVAWGWGPTGGDGGTADEPAGRIFTGTAAERTVTKGEFAAQAAKARGYFRWEMLQNFGFRRNEFIKYITQQGWGRNDPEQQIGEKTWEMIVLLNDARMKGLRVTDEEVEREARSLFDASGLEMDERKENYARFALNVFGIAGLADFEEMLRDALLIDKNLDYEVGGSSIRFAEVYQKMMDESRRARVQVAAVDPEPFHKNPRPIGPEAIAKHYEQHKQDYEMPAKAQVEVLMASLDEFKKREPEPSEEQIKLYYEKNPSMFEKEHAHAEGEAHRPDEPKQYKPIEDVRGEIIDKIKTRDAAIKARETARAVQKATGDLEYAATKQIREEVRKELADKPKEEQDKLEQIVRERLRAKTAVWFEELKRKFDASGPALTHDITIRFDQRRIEDAWKVLGKPAQQGRDREFGGWAFSAPVGDLWNATLETEKGFCVLRLAVKEDAYVPDLIHPVRERIRAELMREDAGARAHKVAASVQEGLVASGGRLSALRPLAERHAIAFQQSDYFGARPGADEQPNLGLGEYALASQIRSQTFSPPANPATRGETPPAPLVEPGRSFVIDGSRIGADKQLWSYVVYVEDVITVTPESIEVDFKTQRGQLERQESGKARTAKVKELMGMANVKKDEKEKKPADAPPPAP